MMNYDERVDSCEYQRRRRDLARKIKEDSLIVLFSGVEKKKSADENYPFEVNKNFYYLTGIDQSDSVIIISVNGGIYREYLFVAPYDEKKEKWTGKLLTFAQASEISACQNVLPTGAFGAMLERALGGNSEELEEPKHLYFDFEKENKIAEETSVSDFRGKIAGMFPAIPQFDVYPYVTTMRLVKSSQEMKLFKRAVSATKAAIEKTVAAIRPGVREYELADAFLHEVNDQTGYQGLSFATIMASGKNAAILHYPTPKDTCLDGDLILMDLGGRFGYYNADVSRTFPVNGKFDDLQLKLYEMVLNANKLVISLARPGVTIRELQNATKAHLAKGMVDLGLMDSEDDLIKYYFHGVSHLIGLDTHDPYESIEGSVDYHDIPLQPGMIISDEPGIYIAERGIGIRIEDDLYITESGCVNLTSEILKEPKDIEAFFSKLQGTR